MCVRRRDRATPWHWHGGVYLIMSAAETTFNSKRESKNRYGHGRSGRTYGYGPVIKLACACMHSDQPCHGHGGFALTHAFHYAILIGQNVTSAF